MNYRLTALIVAALSLLPVSVRSSEEPTVLVILDRAAEYLARFKDEFSLLISDEEYDQRVTSDTFSGVHARQTQSEMAFMWVPGGWSWLTVRSVTTVDGRPVAEGRNRLMRALADPDSRIPQLRALRELSARFNLGNIARTINDPTLALLFVERGTRERFTFTLSGREQMNGSASWKLGFEERRRPSLIHESSSGDDLLSSGAVWIGVADGAVVRTDVTLRIPQRDTVASVAVDYQRNERFGIWVPARMHEGYTQWFAHTIVEHIECVAVYSNFRRFETFGRVLAPQ